MAAMIRVAAGVILNQRNEVLLALRPLHKHQGGLWEFPGGKIEEGESVESALARELLEELDIVVLACEHFLVTEHDYGDKHVCLEVRLVKRHAGQAKGREGQELAWVPIQDLSEKRFPAANDPIVKALLAAADSS
jgi:8-oxo-dGTP diphosphatase